MNSIFSKIIAHEVSAVFIYEDDICIAVMDKFPTVVGQSLIIPKQEVDYVFDLDDATYNHIFGVAKMIAQASDKALNTKRTCLAIEGFEVAHAHIKLYPMTETTKGLGDYLQGGIMAENKELTILAERIKSEL